MRAFNTTILTVVLAASAFACSIGEEAIEQTATEEGTVTYLDTDGDGFFDAIDVDGDGFADHYFDLEECGEACNDVRPVAYCTNPLVDTDGDGQADGVDWNCDGIVDVHFGNPPTGGGNGGGGGGGGYCKTSQSINGQSKVIECNRSGGVSDCTCSRNGSVVSTCTTNSNSACSQPGNGNCCGF